jgi:hypothetical protein
MGRGGGRRMKDEGRFGEAALGQAQRGVTLVLVDRLNGKVALDLLPDSAILCSHCSLTLPEKVR